MSKHSTKKPGNEKVQVHKDGSKERWRDVVGHEGLYRVSDRGRVKSLLRSRRHKGKVKILKPQYNGDKRSIISLSYGAGKGKRRKKGITYNVAALVLLAFVGKRPKGMYACHENDKPWDDRLENLRWDTHKGNMGDKIRNGNSMKGSKHPRAKVDENDIMEMNELYATGRFKMVQISKMYGLADRGYSFIHRGLGWKHVK